MSRNDQPFQLTDYTPYIVYVASIVLVFIPFLIFVLISGWGNDPNSCLLDSAGHVDSSLRDNCFCERVDVAKVVAGEGGVRQPTNTWSNLYALFTALVVAIGISRDRRQLGAKTAENLIQSRNLLADLFVFAVFFLGFGSMWYHASITQWGGKFDGMSMYVFVGYMICYTLYRLVPKWWLFLLVYVSTITIFTSLHNNVDSVILIAINVGLYVLLEIIILILRIVKWVKGQWQLPADWYLPVLWWLSAIACFLLAFMFWRFGVKESSLCNPTSVWQWHGMWHLFAGFMAVFIYYYWRRVKPIAF